MSKEILVEENKVLKLKNVFIKTMIIDEEFTKVPFEKRIKDFEDYVRNNDYLPFGPLIIRNSIIGTEEAKIQLKLMIQLKKEINVIPPYEFIKELKTKPCLFSRFIGEEKDSGLAGSKMQVYAYEHDLVLDVESYSITKKEDSHIVMDTFVPIIGRC